MGLNVDLAENGLDLTIRFSPPFRGLYSRSTPTSVPDGFLPDIVNMDIPSGIPESMIGSTLFATGMTLTGTHTMLATYYSSAGVPTYLGANTTGEVYYWTGSAWTYLLRGLSTSTLWWSDEQVGNVLVITNKNDGIFKYDGTRLLPIGAKHICDMESAEVTWAGTNSADTVNVKQGLQGRKITSTGAAVVVTFTPATALDLINGIGPTARDYTTADRIKFWVYIDDTTKLDTATTYIRLGNAGDTLYFQLTAANWGSLANGWNHVSVLKSAFAITGVTPVWSTIAKVSFAVDATGANTVNATFDDMYLVYASTMPACSVVTSFKNSLIGMNDTSGTSNVNFARVSAPDDWDVLATFPVAENNGDAIVGGKKYYDQVVVVKDQSAHSIYATVSGTTYPAYRFSQSPITSAYGGASHRSIVEGDGAKLYWWTASDIVMYDGTSVQKVSTEVDPTIAPLATRLWSIVGGRLRAKNQLWWAYTPVGASTNTKVLRYDYAQQAWLPSTGQTLENLMNATSSGSDLLLSITSAGRVLQQGSGTTFDTTAISSSLDLPWVSGPDPERMVRWHEAAVGFADSTGTITVKYRTADHPREMATASYSTAQTLTLSSSSEKGRVFIGARSRWLQLQIINVTGAAFQILPPVTIKAIILKQRY